MTRTDQIREVWMDSMDDKKTSKLTVSDIQTALGFTEQNEKNSVRQTRLKLIAEGYTIPEAVSGPRGGTSSPRKSPPARPSVPKKTSQPVTTIALPKAEQIELSTTSVLSSTVQEVLKGFDLKGPEAKVRGLRINQEIYDNLRSLSALLRISMTTCINGLILLMIQDYQVFDEVEEERIRYEQEKAKS